MLNKRKRNFNIFNFYLKKKILMIAITFLPLASFASVLHSYNFNNFQAENNSIEISTSTNDILTIDETIHFSFLKSQPYTKIDISPNVAIKIKWNDDKTKLDIKPKNTWEGSQSYKITFTKYIDTREVKKTTLSKTFKFYLEKAPNIIDSTPKNNSTNITLEDDKIMRIFFDKNILNYEFFVKISNNDILYKDFNSDNNSLTIALKKPIKTKQKLDLEVFGKYSNKYSVLTSLGKLSMHVIPNKPEQWPFDYKKRLKIASESTIPHIGDGKYIDINLKSHVTTLYNDGEIVHQFINSPGADDTPTVQGLFKVENKAIKPLSNTFDVFLPYWMAFTKDGMYGLHGLVEWSANNPKFPKSPQGGKESIKNIDKAVSPGCVRHTDEDSKIIYQWADIGTPVYIYSK